MLASLLSLLALNNLAAPVDTGLTTPPPLPQSISAYAQKTGTSLQPLLEAKSVLSIDLETGKILYQQNAGDQLPMASLTKLMTALVILNEHDLNEIVTVDKRATEVEPAKIYLLAGEKITVRELIKSIFIKSANDSALALGYHDSKNLEDFIAKMNEQARKLGMEHTQFRNPTGFDDPDQYSTVDDLAILARAIYKKPIVRESATIRKTSVNSIDGSQNHEMESTNQLLDSYLKVFGLKTGTTDLAGQCLISIVESPDGPKIMNIMLNSPARYNESKILSQWIFDNYRWL